MRKNFTWPTRTRTLNQMPKLDIWQISKFAICRVSLKIDTKCKKTFSVYKSHRLTFGIWHQTVYSSPFINGHFSAVFYCFTIFLFLVSRNPIKRTKIYYIEIGQSQVTTLAINWKKSTKSVACFLYFVQHNTISL